jgi:hypothetical protein
MKDSIPLGLKIRAGAQGTDSFCPVSLIGAHSFQLANFPLPWYALTQHQSHFAGPDGKKRT